MLLLKHFVSYCRIIDDKSYNLNTWTSTLAGLLDIPLQPNYIHQRKTPKYVGKYINRSYADGTEISYN